MENKHFEGHTLDLPLSANFQDIEVVHFVLDLACSMEIKSFQGDLTIFCRIQSSKEVLEDNTRNLSEVESESLLNKEYPSPNSYYTKTYPVEVLEVDAVEKDNIDNITPLVTSAESDESFEHISLDNKTKTNFLDKKDKSNSSFLNRGHRCSEIILDCSAIDINHCILYDHDNLDLNIDEMIKESRKPVDVEHLCTSVPEKSNLHISKFCMDKYLKNYTLLKAYRNENFTYLKYTVLEHCLMIHLPQGVRDKTEHIIKINFKTRPEGPSLMWTLDQSNMPCVFTVGHQLNNRSLFPSQDLAQAMSTWHCFITLGTTDNDNTTVVTTGEAPAKIIKNNTNETVYEFYNSYPMPASTFALAIGSWTVTDLSSIVQANEQPSGRCFTPTCHLFAPSNLEPESTDVMSRYLPLCFRSLDSVLGPYPLKHLNVLIVPDCFDSLGMASPHLILLSQSVLCPDMSMLLRLAHELCHTWFGILTGPRDWTEEWLTEGVCCYLEDIVHGTIMNWDADRLNLRALIKYKLLAAEVSNISEHLQTLRPNEGSDHANKNLFVKNGLDPEKTISQVHYLKGYFLLQSLEQMAGKELFLVTLKTFVTHRLGQLFSSQEFLTFIFEHCPALG